MTCRKSTSGVSRDKINLEAQKVSSKPSTSIQTAKRTKKTPQVKDQSSCGILDTAKLLLTPCHIRDMGAPESDSDDQTGESSNSRPNLRYGIAVSRPSPRPLGFRLATNPIAKVSWRMRQQHNREIARGLGRGKPGMRRLAQVMGKRIRGRTDGLDRVKTEDANMECEKAIPLLPFARLTKEILLEISNRNQYPTPMKIQVAAISALREAVEGFLVRKFEICSHLVSHGKRITLMQKDMELASRIERAGYLNIP